MKLFKKLLPALTLASVGLCVSPIIASCSLNAKKSTKVIDLKSDYATPIVKQREEKAVADQSAGETLYFTEANQAPGILIDDWCYQWSAYFKGLELGTDETVTVKFTNVETFKTEKRYMVSMKINCVFNYTDKKTNTKYEISDLELTFENIPFEIQSNKTEEKTSWFLQLLYYPTSAQPFSTLWEENSKIYGHIVGKKTVDTTTTPYTGDQYTLTSTFSKSSAKVDELEIFTVVEMLMASVESTYFGKVTRQQ